MTIWLKQSTATVVAFGPFVDKTDGVTLETGLVSSLDHGTTGIRLSKNGGATAVRHATVTATTYDAFGMYLVTLDTTDTNTLGRLRLIFSEPATCLPAWQECMVVPAQVWDSLFGADALQVHVNEITAGLITAAAIADNAIDAGAIATGAITAAKFASGAINAAALATDAVAEIADGVWDEAQSGHLSAGTAGKALDDAKDGDYVGGSATAATNAARGFTGLVLATAVTGTLSTTAFTTSLTEATNDHYNGRTLTFTSGVLAGQMTTISDYNGTTKLVTVAAMTEAPGNGDAFFIA